MLLRPGGQNIDYWFVFQGIDKFIHLITFVVLGFCFMAAFPKTKFSTFIQIMLIYALLTEILQDEMKMGRSLELYDLFADTAGVLLGRLLFNKTKQI
ncbi:VanZ family protein [Chryseobacterium sp. cx-311]|nr:VanZ family protein [Marnyiella aurantia]